MNDYQLIVIGAGPGGYMAALRAAKYGLKTAIVEERDAGGTCLNRGCVPTKALLHTSGLYRKLREAETLGLLSEGAEADASAMYARKEEIVAKLRDGVEGLLKRAKVDYLRGRASVWEAGCVRVTDASGAVTSYTADNILLATGAKPFRPPIEGIELSGVVTSDELLEGNGTLPRSVVIIGGGVIGVEFATFYSDLKIAVTIVEGMDRLLNNMDRELGQGLAQNLKKQGVSVLTNAFVERITKTEEGLCVHYSGAKGQGSVTGEMVLCAIGRVPNVEGLFPGSLQPRMKGRAVRVDEAYRTDIEGLYAIGDVASKVQLAHVATAQGEACIDRLCGRENRMELDVVPSCVYCHPEIASVGITEAEAKAQGISVKVGKCVLFYNARTMIADTGRSFMKVVAAADTHEVLGAQLMCDHATDLIGELAQAIANRMTAEQLLKAMRPHPTFAEALGEALQDLLMKL